MKKIFLTLLLISLFINKVYGETTTISLSYSIEPTYSIVLPNVVDVTNNTSQFTYSISGDIYADTYLEVKFDETSIITNGINDETVYINQSKTNYSYLELLNSPITSSIILTHNTIKAGEYSGQLNLTICLKENE